VLPIIVTLLLLFLLAGCLPGLTPASPKGVISGRVMVPSPEAAKDITGWVPAANATVTLTDSEGVTHTVTTDEDGYYTFTDIAVNANTIITATATIDGNTVIIKDVIPQAVTAGEDYNSGTADTESTALALIVEELLVQGLTSEDINLQEIQASDNFAEVVEQVSSVLEENGNVTTDPDVTEVVNNIAEEIINPPEPEPEPEPTPPAPAATPINIKAILGVTAPVTGETPVTAITPTAQYTGTVAWSPDDDPFLGSVVYTATITLTAKAGFTLTGVGANSFIVTGATTDTNDVDSGIVTAVFPATEAAVITEKAILGVTAPVTGETPVTAITPTDQYTGTVAWSPVHATFAGTTVYTATITLSPETGYTLAGVGTDFFTVDGIAATNDTGSGEVTSAAFPATAAVITEKAITGVTAPVTGETPVTAITPTDQYTGTVAWSPVHATFAGTTVYTATITLSPETGYTLAGVGTDFFTVDGIAATNDTGSGEVTSAAFPATLAVAIGNDCGGGIVAYIFVDGDPGYVVDEQHGLIAAEADQGLAKWYDGISINTGATGTALGTGSANTTTIITIITTQDATAINYAAGLARAYDGDGNTDWFLPSIDELNKLYLNRVAIGGFSTGMGLGSHYWSSTEASGMLAREQNFNTGYAGYDTKKTINQVRAVRAF